jgi:hypothetical protein
MLETLRTLAEVVARKLQHRQTRFLNSRRELHHGNRKEDVF